MAVDAALRPLPEDGAKGPDWRHSIGLGANNGIPASTLVTDDPLQPPADDGWTPARVAEVKSRNVLGFAGSAVQFALGGVNEAPGQRLSTAQVDALAPYYADTYGLDEGFVRSELAKVYLYVGGPATSGAVSIGHHIFVPDDGKSLKHILSPNGKRWLAHELAHTMQFLAYDDSSPHRNLATYLSSLLIGQNPSRPGLGDGPNVWGALFTALGVAGKTEDQIGSGSTTRVDKLKTNLLPAAIAGGTIGAVAGGALAATRATSGHRLLGTGGAMRTGFGVVAAPAIVGGLAGSFEDKLGGVGSRAVGTVAGGLLAGFTLWRGGAFAAGSASTATGVSRLLSRGGAIGAAVAGTLAGAAIGLLSASTSANTVGGWSDNADALHSLQRNPGHDNDTLSYGEALHDAHWVEIEAEVAGRTFANGSWHHPHPGTPVEGRIPHGPTNLRERIDADLGDRLDWGVKIPFIIGVPLALGVGAGVLGTRTGIGLLNSTIRQGRGPVEAIGEAMRNLGDARKGAGNSLGVGAAVTLAPLMVGGLLGPLAYGTTGSTDAARIGGAAAGAVVSGALLTLLLKGRGSGLIATGGKIMAGMAVGAAMGLLGGGVATDALRPHERRYALPDQKIVGSSPTTVRAN